MHPTAILHTTLVIGLAALSCSPLGGCGAVGPTGGTPVEREYRTTLVDTGQSRCYDNGGEIACASSGQPFSGQDAQHQGNQPAYRDNGDGTVTDLVTGLVWTRAVGEKVTWEEALSEATALRLGGSADWRVPTIKELYSLIDFRGGFHLSVADSTPYLDTRYFDFRYGDEAAGERPIDAQFWSATQYVGTTMNGDATIFGVNFADGRIKGYPRYDPRSGGAVGQRMFVRYVRGPTGYGENDYRDDGDGTVTDLATGLMWQRTDDGVERDWKDALAYCDGLTLAGHRDWRLPDAKELQSIVDYARAPQVTGTAAISPPLQVSDPESYFWTSTTHLDGPTDTLGTRAVYVAFGRALGFMEMPPGSGNRRLIDVHGAGAQRSDPKSGDPADYPQGWGPQGDDIRILNHVRCVRGGS